MENFISKTKPPGFHYFSDFISSEEEELILSHIKNFEWEKIIMHGVVAKRRVMHFGLKYKFNTRNVESGKPFPPFLKPFIKRVANQMGKAINDIVQILITEYPIGAGIGWHCDASVFDEIFGISLLSTTAFKLRFKNDYRSEVFKVELAQRSGYRLSKDARYLWQHSISPVKHKRYSITFRTLSKKIKSK